MNRFTRSTWAIAVFLAVGLTACADDSTAPLPADLAPPTTPEFAQHVQDAFGFAGKCMEDLVEELDGSSAVDLNCTAQDMNLFFTIPAAGEELPLCLPGDNIGNVTVQAHIQSGAQHRYAVGLWVRDDGLPIPDALRGDCRHWSLVPVNDVPTPAGENERFAPFYDHNGDGCGDLEQGIQSVLEPITLTNVICQDTNNDGFLDIGACVGYENNANFEKDCSTPEAAYQSTRPGTKAKCDCGPMMVPIRIAGRIIVEKVTVPAGDEQEFTFTGDLAGSITHGQTIEELVEAGTYTATETVPAGWDLTDISCDDEGSSGDLNTATATFNVAAGQTVKCTFTNTKQASVTIKKVTDPAEDPKVGTFEFTQDFDGTGNFTLQHNDTKVFSNITAGVQKTVVELDPTPDYDLTDIQCTGAATWSGTVATRTLQVTPGAGETIVCTFTNTKRGILRIAKSVMPADDDTDFTFTPSGWNNDETFDLGHGETFSSAQLVPGTYSATETVPAEFDLTNRACVHTGSATAKAFTPIANGVQVALGAGEDITCTFTNSRKARLIVTKTIVGGGTQLFDFSRNGTNFTLGDGGSNDSGYALAPDTYTVCELDLAVAWSATVTVDGVPVVPENPDFPEDHGNRCVDVTLDYGDDITVAWTNMPPPEGDARTIGYWRNWSSCTNGNQYLKAPEKGMAAWTLDANLPQDVGDLEVDNCEDAVNILSKRDLNGANKANDGAYDLAAQLLAAKLNVSAGAGVCAAATAAIDAAQEMLEDLNFTGLGDYLRPGGSPANREARAAALELSGILDSYNNNTLCP